LLAGEGLSRAGQGSSTAPIANLYHARAGRSGGESGSFALQAQGGHLAGIGRGAAARGRGVGQGSSGWGRFGCCSQTGRDTSARRSLGSDRQGKAWGEMFVARSFAGRSGTQGSAACSAVAAGGAATAAGAALGMDQASTKEPKTISTANLDGWRNIRGG